ncbi:MAG: CapA family protein [Chloroflexi bacterium]|nr:CapA family protein [Chloroflexota bacterium]
MAPLKKDQVTVLAVGDVSPNRDDPPSMFRYCRDAFQAADVVFGQMENCLSDRGSPMFVLPYSPSKLAAKNISALTEEGAGFDVMSFACNHAMDYGWDAFYDTLEILERNRIAVVGAGPNVEAARKPAVVERRGTRIGFLGYLSVGNPGLVARDDMPGCAPLRASQAYQQVHDCPGAPPLVITTLLPGDKQAMVEDIKKLRPNVDVLIVSMHSGVLHVPSLVAMYQKEAAYSAIDAGADLILQHHAHILRGIEVYKGKTIFYGLGNFALEHGQPFPGRLKKREDHANLQYRKMVSRVKSEPGYEKHLYQHDALKSMVAKAYIEQGRIAATAYLPVYVRPGLEPEVIGRAHPKAQEVFDYVAQISDNEGLSASFSWEGDEVLIT